MLNIVYVYKTSKGYFTQLNEALKKKNRAFISDRPSDPPEREEPMSVKVLTDGESYFRLDSIEVRDNDGFSSNG